MTLSLSILDMVALKLSGIVSTTDAAQVAQITLITGEVMTELERCFKVRFRTIVNEALTIRDELPENETWANVGNEAYYNNLERSIVSDLVAMQYVFNTAVQQSQTVTPETPLKQIKKAKAGSAEVEYDKTDSKTVPFLLNAQDMMRRFKADATRKAIQIGCVIDIADDMTYQAYLKDPEAFTPSVFLVVRSSCY